MHHLYFITQNAINATLDKKICLYLSTKHNKNIMDSECDLTDNTVPYSKQIYYLSEDSKRMLKCHNPLTNPAN